MGFLSKAFVISLGSILLILFAPGIPPNMKFEAYKLMPPMALEGVLSPNSILDRAELVETDRVIVGPDSISVRGDEIYAGIVGGELIRIKNGKVTTVARIGKSCEGVWDTTNCGLILGTRFAPDGKLVFTDVAFGIFKVDVDTGAVEKLVSKDKAIEGKLPLFPDDLDVSKDGSIYFSDATTNLNGDINNFMIESIGEPSGRLIKYDAKTKESTVLISGIHFANGVQLSKDEDFVLVSESFHGRVLRYHLKGKKKGTKDIFIDGLPGLPDNIRSNGKDGFYIPLLLPRIPSEMSLVDLAGPRPLLRKFIVRVHFLLIAGLQSIESIFPSHVFKSWIVYTQQFGPVGDFNNAPYKTIIVETDKEGKILGTLQNEKGPVTGVSQVTLSKDYAYLGFPVKTGIYRLKKADLA